MRQSRVLVTGGAGFIGSHLVDRLVSLGHTVAVVDDLSAGRRENVPPQARFYEMDIRNAGVADIFAQERPQVVFHLAAQMSVPDSVKNPLRDADINVLGSLNVLGMARRYEAEKFVFVSSGGAVYGEPQYLPCNEEHPVRPLSPYGAAKYAVEVYLHMYGQTYGLPYAILRYSNVYGPRQEPHGETGVIPIFALAMMRGVQPVVNGDGEQERDFVYVGDVVEATVSAMDAKPGLVCNIGSGVGTSINRVFAVMRDLLRYQDSARHGPDKPGEVVRIFLDIDKARRELGWSPKMPLGEGLRLTVEHFQRSHSGV